MDDQVVGQPNNPIYQEPKTRSAKWLWVLVILIIIGGLVFAYVRGIGPFANNNNLVKSEPSPTPEVVTETSPTPEASASPSSPTIAKASAKIRVLNGNGKAGVGSAMKEFIEGKGYKVATLGNADNYDFTQTEVKVKDKFKSFESVLISDLADKYSAVAGSKPLEASDSADIQITVGAK